jgi:hypothetical protein
MGLKTSSDGKVCCNFCGTTLLVKTFSCPFRFCEQTAMCPACSKQRPHLRNKAGHRFLGCEANAARIKSQNKQRQEIFSSGKFLLAISRKANSTLVHAIFRSDTSRIGRFLPETLLQKYELEANPTLEDFERSSGITLPEAPSDFDSPDTQAMLAVAALIFSEKLEYHTTDQSRLSDQARLF